MKSRRMLAVLMLLAGCSTAGQSTSTTTIQSSAPTTTTVQSTTTTTSRVVLPGFVEGTLPDGTDYRVTGLPLGGEHIQTIQAPIMIEQGAVVGIASMIRSEEPVQESYWESETRLVVPTEGWTIEVSVDPEVMEELGPDAAALLLSGIRGHTSLLEMPVLDLAYPFRLGGDEEAPAPLLVGYETFEVRRGCTFQLASECESGLQAVPVQEEDRQSRDLGVELIWGDRFPVEGEAFDPGPLGPRINHAVVWTGTELTVFGGSGGDSGPVLNDGAAFDPRTGTWRLLSRSPLPFGGARLLAIWTGAEMIVPGPPGGGNAAAYEPARDRWRLIADPPISPHQDMAYAWTGQDLVIWSPSDDQLVSYDPVEDNWTPLSETGLDAESGALYWMGGHLYAVGTNFNQGGPCEGVMVAVLEGDAWIRLPNGEMGTRQDSSCGNAQLTATIGEGIYVVDGGSGARFRAFDTAAGAWIDLPSPPIPGSEGFPSPVVMGDSLLVHSHGGQGAMYRAATNSWREVSLPVAFAEETVWTGTELLSWGYGLCCPPQPPLAWRVAP